MWIFWALLSALSAATRRTNEKKLTFQLHHLTIALMVQLFALPVILTAVLLRGDMLSLAHLSYKFWLPLIAVCAGFYPLNAFLYFQAVKRSEISSVLPIQSLLPAASLILAWVILHQTPTLISTVGVILIVGGVYALGLKGKRLHHPFRPFVEERGSLFMLLSVLLNTAVGVLDKIAIGASNATFYSLISTIGAVITLFVTMRLTHVSELGQLKKHLRNLGLTGTLQGTSYTTYLLAISTGPIAYATALRSSNVLIGSLLGIVLLKEKLTKPKILSFCLILIGGVVLALGS